MTTTTTTEPEVVLQKLRDEDATQNISSELIKTHTSGIPDEVYDVWVSAEIHLDEIDIQNERFAVFVWFNFLWRDEKDSFLTYLSEDEKKHFFEEQSIDFDQLSMAAKKYLPVHNLQSFIKNMHEIKFQDKHVCTFGDRNYNAVTDHDEQKKDTDNNEAKWEAPQTTHLWQLHLAFRAICSEQLELNDFPFDGQFLNIKFKYDLMRYKICGKCPDWLLECSETGRHYLNRPLQIGVNDNLKSKWKILPPWMDLRLRGCDTDVYKNQDSKIRSQTRLDLDGDSIYDPDTITDEAKFDFRFSLIRLRVVRYPLFYIYNGIFPLFLLVACSFAAFTIENEGQLGDKLAYVVMLLLTVSAFQYSLSTNLPQNSDEMTMIDTYILVAYFVLSAIVGEIALTFAFIDDEDTAFYVDIVVAAICAIIWVSISLRFLFRYIQFQRGTSVDWKQMSINEMRTWHRGEHDSKFKLCDTNNLYLR